MSGLVTGGARHYVRPDRRDEERAHRMTSSTLQLIGFVVLAAIVLATGFGAMGAAGAF